MNKNFKVKNWIDYKKMIDEEYLSCEISPKNIKDTYVYKIQEIKTEKFLSYLIKQFNTTQNTLYLDIIMKYEEIFEGGKDE